MNQEIKQRIEQIKRGEVPQGYKKMKVGIVPSEWDCKQLLTLVLKLNGKAGAQSLETLSISAGKGFVNQAEKFGKELSGNQYVNYTVISEGDFSYNKGNSKKYPQGCIYMLKNKKRAAVPNVFNSFRFENQHGLFYEQLFINGALNRQLFRYINSGVRNDGLLNLYDEDFYSCNIVVPPILEQEKIAEILTTCDNVIELKEKRLAEKQAQKKWFMQNLLTGKKRLSGFSGKWEKVKLKSVLYSKSIKEAPSKDAPLMAFIAEKGVSHKGDRYDRSALVKDKNKLYKRTDLNDFIYSSNNLDVGSIGLNQYGSAVISDVYEIFQAKENANIVFLNGLIQNPRTLHDIVRYRQGVIYGQYRIHADDFLSVEILLPSSSEQTIIAEILTIADKEIELLQKQLTEEKQKKKALMQLLLTGIVRV